MKQIITLTSVSVFLAMSTPAQVPACAWLATAKGNVEGNCIYSDAEGNIFMTGAFSSTSIVIGTTTLQNTATNGVDIYIVKYNGEGIMQWAKKAGGIYGDRATALATDAAGNVFVTGHFNSPTLTFDATALTNSTTTTTNDNDVFIAKYDQSGNLLWARSVGGPGYDESHGITVDPAGNAIIIGDFEGSTMAFPGATLINTGANGTEDFFVAKWDPLGNFDWAKKGGGDYFDSGLIIDSDNQGNVIISGKFASTVITLGSVTINNVAFFDVFLSMLDASGNVKWAKSIGGSSDEETHGLSVDPQGKILITGAFTSPTLGIGTSTIINNGNWDTFIAKFDATGNVEWADGFGGPITDIAMGLCTDPGGNALLGGYFGSPTLAIGSTALINSGSQDVFFARYSPNGNVDWAGSVDSAFCTSVGADPNGNLLLSGSFGMSIFTIDSHSISTKEINAPFVAKLGSSTTGIQRDLPVIPCGIFPNPAHDHLHFVVNDGSGEADVTLRNCLGQIRLRQTNTNSFTIDLSPYPTGLYFLEIRQGSNYCLHKIVKN